ncbi:MAG: FliM/FliN family flagellar motor switch protein [Phycisphaerae bacterium]
MCLDEARPVLLEAPISQRWHLPVLTSQTPRTGRSKQADLNRILSIEVPVIVKLAERRLKLSEVMRLGTGAIIEFEKDSEEPLQLLINNKTIGIGEAVKVGENFGIRITQIGELRDVIEALSR